MESINSKWGSEESETIDVINEINYSGKVLNLAAGDGRFNNLLLDYASEVIAVDNDINELKILESICPEHLRSKLSLSIIDITKTLPYKESTFDGIFCTGTLHGFDTETIKKIMLELNRVLKKDGKIVIDFATDVERVKENGDLIIYDGEGLYTTNEALELFKTFNTLFNFNIKYGKCHEPNLFLNDEKYDFKCNFLLLYGTKK